MPPIYNTIGVTAVLAAVVTTASSFGERQGTFTSLTDGEQSKTLCPQSVFSAELPSSWHNVFDHFYVCTAGKQERLDHMEDMFKRLKVPKHKHSLVKAFNFKEWGTPAFRTKIKTSFDVKSAANVFWTKSSGVSPSLSSGKGAAEGEVQFGKWVSGFEPIRIETCQAATMHNTMNAKQTMNKCGGIGCTFPVL